MSGKKKRDSARAVPRAYGRLTRHERDTVQRMLERRASCREIARELGRSPSTVSAEVASHRFVTAPKARRGERVDASADLSAACPRLAAWPRCCNWCGRQGETRLFYCDSGRSDQKGACERNHVEIRKLLPKGAGIRFDRLAPADLALAMSNVNSEPRGALGFATPARAFRAMLGEDAAALLDAYGVGDVPLGDLDLTPGLIERARAERGDAPLA